MNYYPRVITALLFAGRALLLLLILLCLAPSVALAQNATMQVQPGVGGVWATEAAETQPQPDQEAAGEKPEETGDKEENKEGQKGEEGEKEEGAADAGVVKRPDKPPRVPDPRELEAEPNKGRVRFSFTGQAWPDVLQWLANVSDLSLDWQELPSGYLNLTTQRPYSLDEARDLLNGRLQSRGYTMLLKGDVLSVVKIDKIDPSLVPRVTEEDLYDLQPHDYVKITFQLPRDLDVKEAVEDVKHTLSKPPRVMPLAATKRLLIIDSVANLRMVSALLNEERLEQEGREVPRSFKLRHARAEKVIDTLYVVLGLDPAAQPSQMELQVQQQKMQLLMQMQGAGKDVSRLLNKDGPPVYLAFNRHENSVLANAPERELKIIERTIKLLDIPAPGSTTSVGAGASRFPKTYELDSIEPKNLLSTLEEIGDLDPLAELRADNKAKILFVRGTRLDHEKVTAMIGQLDRSGLKFEVFQLRRLPADAVANTITALLGEAEEDEDSSYRRYYYYFSDQGEEEEEPAIRVDADIENNRLLVRGTEQQIEQVRDLLEKMGELGDGSESGRPMVVTDPLDPEATERLLEQLKKMWPSIGGGAELIIQGGEATQEAPDDKAPEPTVDPTAAVSPEPESAEPVSPEPESRVAAVVAASPFRLLATSATPSAAPQPTAASESKPAVSVTVTPEGRLVLGATDPRTLARLEQLILSLAPPPELFKEFPVQHASAYYIHWKLEDYFEEEIKGEQGERVLDWWGGWRQTKPKDSGVALSRRRRLRLIYNSHTNSIVAANASSQQLQTIDRLIKTWDTPPRADAVTHRRTGMVKVRYSRAKTISDALKEVYRDLLSSRDKEFDSGEEKGKSFTLRRTTEIEFSGVDSSSAVAKTKPIEVGFDGALSIGVDEVSNMLVISAERELYDSVVAMIRTLDEEARPKTSVEVVRVGVSAEALRKALGPSIGMPWPGNRPEKVETQPGEERQQERRDRERRNRNRRNGR